MTARQRSRTAALARQLLQRLIVGLGAIGLTLAVFLLLPLIQVLASETQNDVVLNPVDVAALPRPDPIVEEPEPEPEEEPEEEPPELEPEVQPLDLAQLELTLEAGFGDGWAGGDFSLKLDTLGPGGGDADALFSFSDLDQEPRVTYSVQPVLGAKLRKKGGGTVYLIFVVDADGRVQNPKVESSPDPAFDNPALTAIKKWRFEPGKRSGKPVPFRMRLPMTFPGGNPQ